MVHININILIIASILLLWIIFADLQWLSFEFRRVFWTKPLYLVYEVLKSI